MEVCELDPEMVGVAEKWFGFERSARGGGRGGGGEGVSLHVEDGASFVVRSAASLKEGKRRGS